MRDYREVLSTVDIPMLACAGADEKWRAVDVVEQTAELVSDARFELFEERGHCLTIEEPDGSIGPLGSSSTRCNPLGYLQYPIRMPHYSFGLLPEPAASSTRVWNGCRT